MEKVNCLLYVSKAVKNMNQVEIDYLLTRARERNKEYNVTGILLFASNRFMQFIEGPTKNIDTIYDIIVRDKQHDDIELKFRRDIPNRYFDGWSMLFCAVNKKGYVGDYSDWKNIESIIDEPELTDNILHRSLREFWQDYSVN